MVPRNASWKNDPMKPFIGRVLVAVAISFSCIGVRPVVEIPDGRRPADRQRKFNPSAPAPRTPDGKPDFTGIWLTESPNCPPNRDSESLVCGVELPMSPQGINMGIGMPGGLPYQPWLAALVKERTANNAKDDPHVRCLPDTFIRAYGLPHLLKFVQTSGFS